jgi:hypothetical protein
MKTKFAAFGISVLLLAGLTVYSVVEEKPVVNAQGSAAPAALMNIVNANDVGASAPHSYIWTDLMNIANANDVGASGPRNSVIVQGVQKSVRGTIWDQKLNNVFAVLDVPVIRPT